MLTTYRQAYKTLVYAEIREGHKVPVGIFIDFVINPDSGVMEALWLQTLQGKKCLNPEDIAHWRSSEILIKDPVDCYDPAMSPKIKKLSEKECAILGANVYSWPEKKLIGQVSNFGFDTISPRILSLHARAAWWQPWRRAIISQERIHKITDKGIFVHNQAIIKAETKALEKVSEAIHSVEEIPKVDCDD